MKKIKIILVLFIVIVVTGCSVNDDANTRFFFKAIPIEKVTIPERFKSGETEKITVSFFRPSTCHSFSGFDNERTGNERTIVVINVVIEDGPVCEDLEKTDLIEESFDFFVGQEDAYVFRFWQGRDDQNNNQFLTIQVPVDK